MVNKLNKNNLPDHLKDKTNDEIKKYVAEKRMQRASIQTQIQALNYKRNKFVAQKQSEQNGENSLESALISSIKRQALKKNFNWEKP